MRAGEIFEQPDEGDIRIVVGKLSYWLPNDVRADDLGYVVVTGLLVQEYGPQYDEEGFELTGEGQWDDLCPLVDFPILYRSREWQLPNLRREA